MILEREEVPIMASQVGPLEPGQGYEPVRDAKLTIGRLARALLWIVCAWVILDLVLLFLAFVLRLFGANPDAGFTEWVYRSVERAMAPFRGTFEPVVINDQSVLDTSLLFAMIVYGFVALFLHAGIDWVTTWANRHRRQLQRRGSSRPPGAIGDAGHHR
jgi:uncharacterized protein YggT (Ycf19 family)